MSSPVPGLHLMDAGKFWVVPAEISLASAVAAPAVPHLGYAEEMMLSHPQGS